MQKLVEFDRPIIRVGMVLRFITRGFLVEKPTDFLVFNPRDPQNGLGLVEATGYHAGEIYVVFPSESRYTGRVTEGEFSVNSISTDWLIQNWSQWVCPKCKVEDAWILDRYPDPKLRS